jgi:hypothetical protein
MRLINLMFDLLTCMTTTLRLLSSSALPWQAWACCSRLR